MVYRYPLMYFSSFSSEVDLNGSLWYIEMVDMLEREQVLKLTSTGHYGIRYSKDTLKLTQF